MVTRYFSTVLILLLCENVECSVELARGKPAHSNGIVKPEWSASKAVDGIINTNLQCNSCLYTVENMPSFLKVDLGNEYTINRVIIYFAVSSGSSCADKSVDIDTKEKFQMRFMRSTIRTHQSLNTIWGYICHRDETPVNDYKVFNLFQNISCHGNARYVSIVQYYTPAEQDIKNSTLAVCEMEVYGCPVGFYGENCVRTCSDQCMNGKCDPDLGCLQCNNDELKGPDCLTECQSGTYGLNCNETCGACLKGEVCDKRNGSCPNKCDVGFTGTDCKTACPNGTYGLDCKESCGNCFEREACDKQTGNCTKGCDHGYEGFNCKKACSNGTFGINCKESCGHCIGTEICDLKNGKCPNGCDLGYTGTTCKKACTSGFYGYDCLETCGYCSDKETCDSKYGICSSCTSGYIPPLCKQSISSINTGLDENNDLPIPAIVGGNVAAVIVIVTVMILGIVWLRKNQIKLKNAQQNLPQNNENIRQREQLYEISSQFENDHEYSHCGEAYSTIEQTEFSSPEKDVQESSYMNDIK